MKRKMTVKIFDHTDIVERPATIHEHVKVYRDIEKDIDFCDVCQDSTADRFCIGCDIAFCNACYKKQEIRLYHTEIETGALDIEPDKDYKFESFYICEKCMENPPNKIEFLCAKIKDMEELERQIHNIKLDIIPEVKRLKGEVS